MIGKEDTSEITSTQKEEVVLESPSDVCKHEILLFTHLLKKKGVLEKFLEERYSNPHYYMDSEGTIQFREFVPKFNRINKLHSDLSNFILSKLSQAKKGKYNLSITHASCCFADNVISFDWDESNEGFDYWDSIDFSITNEPKIVYINMADMSYEVDYHKK